MVTFTGAGLSSDGSGRAGDGTAVMSFAVTVMAAPTPSPSPTMAPNLAPTANAGGPYAAVLGDQIQFDGSGSVDSDGSIASYAWSFGDGTSGVGAKPLHTYMAAGSYTVSLVVKDNLGLASAPVTVQAVVNLPQNAVPVANAGGPYSAAVGMPVAFNGSASRDPDGSIVSYSWSFGDGSSGSGAQPSHSYSTAGTYQVSLVVTDDKGASATASTSVTIRASTTNEPPVADAGGPYLSERRRRVRFDGSKSKDVDGTIIEYRWVFGDGDVGEGPKPSHRYRSAGVYNVVLTVKDDAGAVSTSKTTVTIGRAETIEFPDRKRRERDRDDSSDD